MINVELDQNLEFDRIPSPLGEILVVAADATLVGLDFADGEARLRQLLNRRFAGASYVKRANPLDLRATLKRYFAGDFDAFQGLSMEPGGTDFEARAWQALRAIPAGTTRTYAEQAARIGAPKAVRAIGAANGRNPISIAIPCHRVIGSNRTLTGYAGGVARKQWLLEHEGALEREARVTRRRPISSRAQLSA